LKDLAPQEVVPHSTALLPKQRPIADGHAMGSALQVLMPLEALGRGKTDIVLNMPEALRRVEASDASFDQNLTHTSEVSSKFK
jgi:hypothetical protein